MGWCILATFTEVLQACLLAAGNSLSMLVGWLQCNICS
jgi:hypothetical protein